MVRIQGAIRLGQVRRSTAGTVPGCPGRGRRASQGSWLASSAWPPAVLPDAIRSATASPAVGKLPTGGSQAAARVPGRGCGLPHPDEPADFLWRLRPGDQAVRRGLCQGGLVMGGVAVTSASQAPASSARNDLAARLSALRAAADLAVPDPEISHLAALEDWLSDDPASYFRWIKGVARERLQAEVSESVLRAAIDDLSRDLRDGTIAGFVCGEALQVCLADLTMLEELEETEVPESAVASLRRDLRPASIDLVHRLMRNLSLRDTPAPDEAAPRPGGWPAVPLSEWS